MPLPYKVKSAYERLIQSFCSVADSANAGTVHSLPIDACFSSSEGETTYESYLYLKDWKWRPSKTNAKVDILVNAVEQISETDLQVLKSTVRVSYLSADGQPARLLHTIHFDFTEPQPNHPLFHAQLTGEAIVVPGDKAREIHFQRELPQAPVPCFKNARIPTSDMTLSSVLLCLVADHMRSEFFHLYLTTLRKCEAELPLPKCDALCKSLESACNHLRSRHWFAHMEAGNDESGS